MRVTASTTSLEVWPGSPASLTVSVFNTAEVICGYTFEMLGVDPEWLRLDFDQLNLFPEDTGTVTLTLTLPTDFPAGRRTLAVVVQSALDPSDYRVVDIELDVQATLEARLELEPANFYGGAIGTFGMVISNTGNSWTRMVPAAEEQEAKAEILLLPAEVDVPPGEQVTVTARVKRRRPWIGSAATRIITFRVDGVDDPPQAIGSFTQRPIVGRGLLSLLGLLAALSVFGFVLTRSLGSLVDKTNSNDALIQNAFNQEQQQLALAAANPSSMSGLVQRESTAGTEPVANVTVQLYAADDGSTPIGVVATDGGGRYVFDPIIAGEYKLRAIGAGFDESWYPSAQSFDDAQTVKLGAGEAPDTLDIAIRGRPGTVSGTVLAPDPSDVVISLIQLQGDVRVATVREVTTDGAGVFVLDNIPPTSADGLEPYELVASKKGFAEEHRLITVAEGEVKDDITIRLRSGDARLGGTISLDGDPAASDQLIEVVAAAGGEQYSTVTFDGGQYLFRDLPSPALYSITATRVGYSTETRTRQLDSGASLTGVDIDLTTSVRSIGGTVTNLVDGSPVDGALITVTDGQTTQRARTGSDGLYEVRGLSPMSTYTVTASHPDYRDLTLSCGPATEGCSNAQNPADFRFRLRLATSTVSGVVCNRELRAGTETVTPLGGVTVDLSSASFEATTVSANGVASNVSVPDAYAGADCSLSADLQASGRLDGFYRFNDVPIGTYTLTFTQEGGLPFTQVITVPTSGPVNQTLVDTSSITVSVVDGDGAPVEGVTVDVFTKAAFEADPEGDPGLTGTTAADGVIAFNEIKAPEDYVVIVHYLRPGDDQEQVYSRSFPLRVGESKSETITVIR